MRVEVGRYMMKTFLSNKWWVLAGVMILLGLIEGTRVACQDSRCFGSSEPCECNVYWSGADECGGSSCGRSEWGCGPLWLASCNGLDGCGAVGDQPPAK